MYFCEIFRLDFYSIYWPLSLWLKVKTLMSISVFSVCVFLINTGWEV